MSPRALPDDSQRPCWGCGKLVPRKKRDFVCDECWALYVNARRWARRSPEDRAAHLAHLERHLRRLFLLFGALDQGLSVLASTKAVATAETPILRESMPCAHHASPEACPHGVRWPHPCRECEDAVDPAAAATWMAEELRRRKAPDVEAGFVGDRVQPIMVRMTCGHLAERRMRPSLAAGLPRDDEGHPKAPFAACPACGGPKPY